MMPTETPIISATTVWMISSSEGMACGSTGLRTGLSDPTRMRSGGWEGAGRYRRLVALPPDSRRPAGAEGQTNWAYHLR
jgi:hypothetical protein